MIRNWMRLVERGGTTAVAAGEEVVPASRVRELEQQVKQLFLAGGGLESSGVLRPEVVEDLVDGYLVVEVGDLKRRRAEVAERFYGECR